MVLKKRKEKKRKAKQSKTNIIMDCLSSTSADAPIGIGLLPTSHPSYEAVVRAVTAEVVFQVYEKLEARFVAKSGAILQPILIDQDEIGCDHSDELLHGYANDLAVAYAAHVSIGSVFGVDESAGVRDVVDTLKDASQSVGVVLKHGRYLGDKLDLVASLSASSVEGEFQLARDRYDSFSYSCGLSPREVEWIDTDYFVRKGLTNNDLIGLMYPYHPMMIREERGTIPDTGLHFDKRDGKLFVRYPHGVWPDEQFDLNDWYRWVTERLYKVGRQEEPVRTESAKELADYVVVMNFLLGAVVRDFMLKFENLLRDQHCRITKEYLPVEFDDYGALDGDVRSALAVALEGLVLEKMRLERGKGGTCSIAGLHVGLVPFASGWLAAGKVMSVAMRAERMVITPRGTFFRSGT